MAIAQFFFPPPLCSPICDLPLRRVRCDWESCIFSCDHDRKTEEIDPYISLSLLTRMFSTIGRIGLSKREVMSFILASFSPSVDCDMWPRSGLVSF